MSSGESKQIISIYFNWTNEEEEEQKDDHKDKHEVGQVWSFLQTIQVFETS